MSLEKSHTDKNGTSVHDGNAFNEKHILHELKHYLPSQTPIRDFIHHNSLHAFQQMKFYDAIEKASKLFGYQTTLQLNEFRELFKNGRIRNPILERIISRRKGADQIETWKEKLLHKNYDTHNESRIGILRANWKTVYSIDLDSLVQPFLFRILCAYLDQGISIWQFPADQNGFLNSIREMERSSFVSIFKTSRARQLFLGEKCDIKSLLDILVGKESCYHQYLFDQQFSHRGWSGIVSAIEEKPDSLLDKKAITLQDLIMLELLLEIDMLDFHLGQNWKPLATNISQTQYDLFAPVEHTELNDVFRIWQDAFEWSYYDEVMAGVISAQKTSPVTVTQKSFQAVFCIDERECSLRRHIEHVDPACETLGYPGFFGVEFYFQPENAKFYDKLCPAPVTPKYLIKEYNVPEKRKHEALYTKHAHSLFAGFFITIGLGFWAGFKLLLNQFRPKMSPAISDALSHMHHEGELTIENKNPDDRENNLQIGFTITEMADRTEALLRNTGMIRDFAPIIYIIAHGSSSANNPHHGAHDCGACSGRPGSVNARVFAFMANHKKVREVLKARGIHLPEKTQFVGGLHDTASDEIAYYDIHLLNPENQACHKKNSHSFERALDLNAKERSRRFASINTKKDIRHVREAIRKRSVSLFEPRPELGHGTNTLCIVGERKITKGLFLDRRAFLNSYDYRTDRNGDLLLGVMKPLGPVCGGINLEYYFSRVDNYKLGAGTKLPHNVMGLIGVANSCDGDLRPGLPVQMIEVHDPVRLLIIVEHFPEVVLKTIQSVPEVYEWYINEWVHLAVFHPQEKEFYYFSEGAFTKYVPLADKPGSISNMHVLIESATEMKSAAITDATREHLPVSLIE